MRTGEPLPAVGDVLAALATGMWHWDTATGTVSVDIGSVEFDDEAIDMGASLVAASSASRWKPLRTSAK